MFVSLETLEKTGLVKPGTLVRWRYALARNLGYDEDKEQLKDLRERVQKDLPEIRVYDSRSHKSLPPGHTHA